MCGIEKILKNKLEIYYQIFNAIQLLLCHQKGRIFKFLGVGVSTLFWISLFFSPAQETPFFPPFSSYNKK
jgi:hypothetical protein